MIIDKDKLSVIHIEDSFRKFKKRINRKGHVIITEEQFLTLVGNLYALTCEYIFLSLEHEHGEILCSYFNKEFEAEETSYNYDKIAIKLDSLRSNGSEIDIQKCYSEILKEIEKKQNLDKEGHFEYKGPKGGIRKTAYNLKYFEHLILFLEKSNGDFNSKIEALSNLFYYFYLLKPKKLTLNDNFYFKKVMDYLAIHIN